MRKSTITKRRLSTDRAKPSRRQQDWHSFVVDGCHQLVGCGGKEGVDFEVGLRFILSDRPLIAAPNPGEGEQWPVVLSVQREPVPCGRFDVSVGFAKGHRRHQTTPFLERAVPKPAFENLVISDIGYASRGSVLLEQHKAPTHQDDLTIAIGALSNDGRHMPRKDRRQWFEGGTAIV
jgi:hypothetical protein